ncbi:MAG: hemolysin [Bacteroidetes bacterium]|nr:MAG: hemolysin [Bacteroidota bacterium]
MEIAFVSANKLRIELDKKQGIFASRIVRIFTNNQGQYISTMLVGNNIALVIYGVVMAGVLEPVIMKYTNSGMIILFTQTIISTLIILVTAEFLPKTLFRINPNKILNFFSVPVLLIYYLLYPISKFTIWISSFLLKLVLKVDINEDKEQTVFGKVDLDNIIDVSQPEIEIKGDIEHDIKLFQNALDFSKIKLRECVVPRTELIALEIESSIKKLKQKFIESGLSKILIYKETIDNIIGYVQSPDLFHNPKDISSMIKSLIIVPETMPANKLLNTFMKKQKSIALIVDEFGGTAGIVTIEDIMEEIFGEIEDEHDSVELQETKINDNEYIFSGRLEIDHINEKYAIEIPESEEYETIAGFILYHYEQIPYENDQINIKPFEFEILKVDRPRIELIKLTIRKK